MYIDPSGNIAQGGGDCVDCGLTPGQQTGIGNGIRTLHDNWDNWGIKDWFKRNFNGDNFSEWRKSKISINNIFGRHKNSGPPPNRSSYVGLNTMGLTGAPVNAGGLDSVNWYEPGGQVNWFLATASGIGTVKGGLNSERMYAEGVRRGISSNYQLSGRNLSMFRDAPATKASLPLSKVAQWAKVVGEGSFYAGVIMDVVGVGIYAKNPDSPNAVHPAKAIFNTYMGATGTYGGTLMAIPSTLYFGIDAFYPKGWKGLAIDQESLYRDNKAINPSYQAFPGAMKF